MSGRDPMSRRGPMGGDVQEWLSTMRERHPLAPDDVLHSLLPLFEQTARGHEQGKVAPLLGLEGVKLSGDQLYFSDTESLPQQTKRSKIEKIDPESHGGIAVAAEHRVDELEGERGASLTLGTAGKAIERPVYLTGWTSWEHEIEHHDPLTDIFTCGMLLSALITGLDLNSDEGLREFVEGRGNLFAFNPELNPVFARVALEMTEVSRHRRVQDLPGMIALLRGYRRQTVANTKIDIEKGASGDSRSRILGGLRERLFDISRRNRLLYFKPTLGLVALTEASIPLRLDPSRIQPDELFTWQGKVAARLSAGKDLSLGELLRFEDAPYLPGLLDRLRSEDRKTRQEVGFSSLRLALIFLRWNNLKEAKHERIQSPLLLLPVTLEKKKGVRDAYILSPSAQEAEVNPVLRHHLEQLYGLRLPDRIALDGFNLLEFHRELTEQIRASEPGITLNLIEKPQIDLIHTRARRRVEVFRRRTRLTGRGIRRLNDIDYSYSASNFQPLGLQLYLQRVRAQDWPLSHLTDAAPRPRTPMMTEAGIDGPIIEKTNYSLRQEEGENPYSWDIDACSMILGNFNYRKMSLVRDYEQLLDEPNLSTPVFEDLFTSRPRNEATIHGEFSGWGDRWDVVPCDPTQSRAVAAARRKEGFIIQGPPGTGKSQTITNLIADAVALEKRVLFVCEKRAALDVVYHRLKQQGLERLCCLIHDAQDDKKNFVRDIKNVYEHYCANPDTLAESKQARQKAIASLERSVAQLGRYSEELNTVSTELGLSAQHAIRRLIALGQFPILTEEVELPSWREVAQSVDSLKRLEEALEDLGEQPCLGKHPLRLLQRPALLADRITEHVRQMIQLVLKQVEESRQAMDGLKGDLKADLSFEQVGELLDYAASIADISEAKLSHLLSPGDPGLREIDKLAKERRHLLDAVEQAKEKTGHWKMPFGRHELGDLLALCSRVETSWLRFLMPSFWNLKRIMHERYDLGAHAVAPTWSRLLSELQGVHEAEDAVAATDKAFAVDYLESTAVELKGRLEELHLAQDSLGPGASALRSLLLRDPLAHRQVALLLATRPVFEQIQHNLGELVAYGEQLPFGQIPDQLRALDEALSILPDVASLLGEFASGPEAVHRAAVMNPWSAKELEYHVLRASLDTLYTTQRSLAQVNVRAVQAATNRLTETMTELRELNGRQIVDRVHHNFRSQIAKAGLPTAQLTKEEKAWKKRYAAGRKELEHEFGKVMRHKSIRLLAAEESGEVLADLKPIWLMSPLSVSDTLPLDPEAFDVVVFDEASQITLEEAIPALFRAQQAIVVGDEQQLPPTRFFGAKASDEGDEDEDEDEASAVALALGADSFLSHSARTLKSTMLGWHYRSRFESLIDFSNASFYNRQLLTIPDVHLTEKREAIVVNDSTAPVTSTLVTERPISFHYLPEGVYDKRTNADEARYIAQLVASLLKEQPELTIGIVAFSEAQQSEIESALAQRATEEDGFAELHEAAVDRVDDDQFVGLFVKNLENVQGDERDVIILSICYGYDHKRKMRMNFGPINQQGGEKRLNVVFSRAKRHMVVVSSIEGAAITNDYNDGANCLKRYLRFAAAASVGNTATMERVLEESCPDAGELLSRDPSVDPTVISLRNWLEHEGFAVDEQVGSSRFRCDLAVRGQGSYQLGILVDTDHHYQNQDVVEQYVQRPQLLSAFQWKVHRVLAKDWLEEREQVQKAIRALLK